MGVRKVLHTQPSASLKVISISANGLAIYDFLLICRYNYVSVVPFPRYYHLFPKF